MSRVPRSRLARRLSWLVVLSLMSVALFAPGATVQAASVTPIAINDGNPTCADFAVSHGGGQTWLETKSDPPGNGTITVAGFGTITITSFTQSDSGTPGSFSWSSTFGIDAVFVKAGSDKHNLYVYASTAGAAESTGDTGLSPQAGTGNGISHISFCYDANNPATPAPPTPVPPTPVPPTPVPPTPVPPTPVPPTPVPPTPVPPTPTPGVVEGTPTPAPTPTPTPEGGVGGATATPPPAATAGTTLPPTDTLGEVAPATGGDNWRIVLLALAGILATALLLTPARAFRKDR